ncbi:MAG: hypothetical protein ACJAWV_002836 [Flammeovirgaceae bacterium]|jgi:hypothetical protein
MVIDETKPCPVCKNETTYHYPGYPNMVCNKCDDRARDKSGRELGFSNVDAFGGYRAYYLDNGEEYNSHTCYIDGIECLVDEVRGSGGIVIEVWKKNF